MPANSQVPVLFQHRNAELPGVAQAWAVPASKTQRPCYLAFDLGHQVQACQGSCRCLEKLTLLFYGHCEFARPARNVIAFTCNLLYIREQSFRIIWHCFPQDEQLSVS